MKNVIQFTSAVGLYAISSVSLACPCDFLLPGRASLPDSKIFCVAGSYENGQYGKFATFGLDTTNPKNGQIDQWEFATEKNSRLGTTYNCSVNYNKVGKNGRSREVRKDSTEIGFSDAGDYNSCLTALDLMEGSARGGGAVPQPAIFAIGETVDSCNPVDVGGAPFVPVAESD